MLDQKITAPIIVIGMHRSGTTLLTRMLETCGVFWGALPDENNESAFFQSVNEALFAMSSAAWDTPELFENYFRLPYHQSQAVNFINERFARGFISEFCFGFEGNDYFTKTPLTSHWGWKDPRNVYTLGLWLRKFPDARVIHILRNGIDVALSLWLRETNRPEGANHPHYSPLCQDLNGCFNLWKQYVGKTRQWSGLNGNLMEVRFETLISAPRTAMEHLAQFLDLQLDENVQTAVDLIQSKRTAIRSNKTCIQDFIDNVKSDSLLMTLGYPHGKNESF